jgi:signal transduction histidine kinase/ActR/RegA family two-component response regulator
LGDEVRAVWRRIADELTGPTRIVWLVAVAVVVLIAGLDAYALWRAHEKIDADERYKLSFQLRFADERVSGLVRGVNVALEQITRQASAADGVCRQDVLDRYATYFPEIDSFSIIDANGLVRCSSSRRLLGADVSALEYFQANRRAPDPAALVIDKPRVSRGGEPTMDFAKPMVDRSGGLSRIAVARIDLRYFDAMLRSMLRAKQIGVLFHQSGLFASRIPDPDKYRFTDLSRVPSMFAKHVASKQRLTVERGITQSDNKDRYAGLSDVVPDAVSPTARLVVGVGENAEDVFAQWRIDAVSYSVAGLLASLAILGMASLISRRHREIIRAKDEALAANKAKSRFLSSMSHELRTPLNAILGFSQIIGFSTRDEQVRTNLTHVTKAGWHLLDLINDVIDLSTIEAGKMRISPGPIDLKDLVSECLALIEPLAEQRGMSIRHEFAATCAEHCFVQADRIRLKQSILNYLSNAAKYGRKGTEILLSVRSANGKVRIEVSDQGDGIPQEKLEQLFQPFNRLGIETGQVQGVGLGLALTREMVALMGGRTGAESEPGRGSTFWIELDPVQGMLAAAGLADGSARARSEALAVARARALLVEDNPENAQFIATLFQQRLPNVEITLALDGRAGLRLAERMSPDLLLLDIHLPGIDGIELLGRLRAAGIRAPAIALTAAAMADDIAKGSAAGFFAYLTKPLDAARLVEVVDLALGGSRSAPQES